MATKYHLAGLSVGSEAPVRLVGVINVSPESFYRRSVSNRSRDVALMARRMTAEGADILDVGAMSTAPYLKTKISEKEEISRLLPAVRIIKKNSPVHISVDTARAAVARAALKAGAAIVNDVTGLLGDPGMAETAKKARGLILMANPVGAFASKNADPVKATWDILQRILGIVRRHRIPLQKTVLDPGIGFFRDHGIDWWRWDVEVLRHLRRFARLGPPILVGVSRKSFIGHINKPSGKPVVTLSGAFSRYSKRIEVSLSHTDQTVVAVAIFQE